ncbi:hypothetical protein CCP1ISM_20021 [Azospirillaceae bacterium]
MSDVKQEVSEAFTRVKDLVTEIDGLLPKILEGNKSAARKARGSLNSLKKNITPLRKNIQEIIKPSKTADAPSTPKA